MANDPPLSLGLLALQAMREADRQRGVDPTAIERTPSPPSRFGPAFRMPEWDGSSFTQPAPPKPVATEENPGPPPRREPIDTGRIPSPTPNLDAWRAQQLVADQGDRT